MFNSIIQLISGNEKQFSLEHRILNIISFFFVMAALCMSIFYRQYIHTKFMLIDYSLYAVNSVICYSVARILKRKIITYFLLSSTVFVSIFLIGDLNIFNPALIGLVALFSFSIILNNSKYYGKYVLLFLFIFSVVIIQKALFHGSLQAIGTESNSVILPSLFIVISNFLILGIMFFKNNYEKEKRKTDEQYLKIKMQSEILTVQKERIEEESTKKVNFFINLAHETRTPLTLINNYLKRYIDKHGQTQELDIIRNNIDKLNRDMLSFIDSEKLERGLVLYNHVQNTDFSQLIKEKCKIFVGFANERGISLVEELEDNLYVQADPSALDTIINNLLENAIKFTHKKGKVLVKLMLLKGVVELIVKDTGIGISEEQQRKIFEPFYQVNTQYRTNNGIGIGLSLVKNLVKELHGNITLNSIPNKGTEFIISLPASCNKNPGFGKQLFALKRPGLSSKPIKEVKDSFYKNSRSNILIVEDNPELLNYLKEELSVKYNVFVATNGQDALERLKVIPTPQLIISDVMMGEMDGFEFGSAILQEDSYKHIPLIFLTAKTTVADKLKGLDLGAVDFIGKPFSIEELNYKVISIINRVKQQKDAILKGVIRKITEEAGYRLQTTHDAIDIKEDKIIKFGITKREREITILMNEGLSNKEIANKLNISVLTVAKHIQNIFEKTKVNSRIELTKKLAM